MPKRRPNKKFIDPYQSPVFKTLVKDMVQIMTDEIDNMILEDLEKLA